MSERLLLCSDGLSGVVEEHRIASALKETPEPQACATSLMERALASGSDDNVTVIIVRVDATAPARSAPEDVFSLLGQEESDDDDTLVPLE